MLLGQLLCERNKITLRRATRLLSDHPLIGTPKLEETRDHCIELGHRHCVLEEKVGDDEREGFGGRENVKQGHGCGDVTDNPCRELCLWDEHG